MQTLFFSLVFTILGKVGIQKEKYPAPGSAGTPKRDFLGKPYHQQMAAMYNGLFLSLIKLPLASEIAAPVCLCIILFIY